jgi:hypothetical protein
MRESKSIPKQRPASHRSRKTADRAPMDVSQEFMNLAVEAAHCRELPTFLAGLAARAAEMLKADWGGLGEIIGNRVELHRQKKGTPANEEEQNWIAAKAIQRRPGLEILPWEAKGSYCAFYPIYASDHELMGTLCLLRDTMDLSAQDKRLLAALGSYAALVMEKVRRFSQLER